MFGHYKNVFVLIHFDHSACECSGRFFAPPGIHCVSKNIPNIFDCNLKTNVILIIFGMNIPDTTCHQLTIQFSTSPNVCFCTTWGKQLAKHYFLSSAIWLL